MKVSLPLSDKPAFRYRHLFGGARYVLEFRWLATQDSWSLDIYDEFGDELLIAGIRVVYGADLFACTQHIIPGSLRVYPPATGNGDGPRRHELAPGTGTIVEYDDGVVA